MTFLSQLEWRFATKAFDSAKKVSDEDLAKILGAIRMAPTSFGLQPFHVFVVTDPAVREAIKGASWGQAQVTDASHLLVLAARTDPSARIDEYVGAVTGGHPEMMTDYVGMMHGSIDGRSDAEKFAWSAKQAYIALGFGLAAAAELGIDSCPMEGFDGAAVDTILGVPANLKTVAFLPVGYRAAEAERPKFRFSETDLFETK